MSRPPATILDRSPGETASGTEYARYSISAEGREAYVYEPAHVAPYEHTSMLLLVHGMAASRESAEVGAFLAQRDAALDQGIVVGAASHGNLWGNQRVMDDLANVYDWAARRHWIDSVAMFGHSMGGMGVIVAASRHPVPALAGVACMNGMIDVYEYASPFTLSAYGVSTWDELPAAMAGHDPVNDPASNWAGVNVLFIATPSDGTRAMAEAFIARAATPETIDALYGTHGHNDNPFLEETSSWLSGVMVPYDPAQAPPTHYPVPGWDDEPDPAPIPPPASDYRGLRFTDGTPAGLYLTSGEQVSAGVASAIH